MSMNQGNEATLRFRDALEALPEAIAIFDDNDRFVFWNSRFAEIYGEGLEIREGLCFEEHLRASLSRGSVIAATGREEEWLAERLARFTAATGAHEHRLANGRWVRVQDRALAHGGRIGIRSDITEMMNREQSFRLLFEANPAPMIVSDLQTHQILAVNAAAATLYGYSRDDFLMLSIGDIQQEREPGALKAETRNLGDEAFVSELQFHRTASGDELLVQFTGQKLQYAGRPALLAAMFDRTEQHRMEEEVRRTHAFLNHVIDQVPTAVFVKDMRNEGRFVIYNRASEALFGRSREEAIGRSDREVFGAEAAAQYDLQDQVALCLGSVETVEDELIHRPDGEARFVRTRKVALKDTPSDVPRFVVGVSEDVTEQRANEARIAHMAHHDALTDLPNRFLFHDRLASALARLRGQELLAVLFIDLDGFKAVNDTWGHATGDDLLQAVADRLRGVLRSCDTAARFGGDEFAVLQTPISQLGETALLAAKLVATLSVPYAVGQSRLQVGASIGVAFVPFDATEPGDLLDHADAALYCAKREGRNTFRFACSKLQLDGSIARKASMV